MATAAGTHTDLTRPLGRAEHAGRDNAVRPWQVLHLARDARDVAAVLDLQFSCGMQPALVTPEGRCESGAWLAEAANRLPRTASLLSAWREVRTWRRSIAENRETAEILHAHTFSAGMAAVRAGLPLVYDLHGFVEEPGIQAGQSWLARSFRSAEQFVLSRATAVVAHTSAGFRGALERGTPQDCLFLIPDYVRAADDDLDGLWRRTLTAKYETVYAFVQSRPRRGRGPLLPPGWQPLAACV